MKIWIIITVVAVLVGTVSAHGTGEAGAQFLNIGIGAKATALGNSFVGSADDPSAIYWNPAGMAQMEYVEIMASQNFWLEDMSCQFVGAVFPSEYGSFGISFAYSSSGKIPKYDNFTYLGDYSAYDMVGTIAYANNLGDFIAIGGSFKLIQQKIEEESGFGYAFDIGVHKFIDPDQNICIGAVVQNIGPDIKFIDEADPLPFKIKGGVAVNFGSFKITSDITSPKDKDIYFNFGAQLAVGQMLALRTGYNGEQKFTAGVGITLHNTEVGFSYIPMEDLGSSTLFSLAFKF